MINMRILCGTVPEMCIVGVGIACVAGGISVGEQESTPAQEYPAAAQARVGNDS